LEIRKEESKRKHEEGDKIINAQTHNKKVFYQMIRKQRNNRNVIIDDLYVGNSDFDKLRDGIL
jgi:vacuolar-type H+-ATPase subunit I/STV1